MGPGASSVFFVGGDLEEILVEDLALGVVGDDAFEEEFLEVEALDEEEDEDEDEVEVVLVFLVFVVVAGSQQLRFFVVVVVV